LAIEIERSFDEYWRRYIEAGQKKLAGIAARL